MRRYAAHKWLQWPIKTVRLFSLNVCLWSSWYCKGNVWDGGVVVAGGIVIWFEVDVHFDALHLTNKMQTCRLRRKKTKHFQCKQLKAQSHMLRMYMPCTHTHTHTHTHQPAEMYARSCIQWNKLRTPKKFRGIRLEWHTHRHKHTHTHPHTSGIILVL